MQAHPGHIEGTGVSDDRPLMIDLRHVQKAFRGVPVLVDMSYLRGVHSPSSEGARGVRGADFFTLPAG